MYMHAEYTSVLSHQATHAAPTLSASPHPLAPCTHPPSLPHDIYRCVCVCVCLYKTVHDNVTCQPSLPSPPYLAPYTLPPSLPYSLKRRELVKDARRQHADRVAVQVEVPGYETRTQSAPSHCTCTCPLCASACTCTRPMHVPHAHARVHRASLSFSVHMRTLWLRCKSFR